MHKFVRLFSGSRFLAFVLAFAIVGTYFMLNSFAANPSLPGDENNDGMVNLTDLSILLSAWNTQNAAIDLNGDLIINVNDLSILLSHWGQTGSTGSAPVVTLTASPTSITSGQSSTLTWSANHATSCSGDWTTSHAVNGTQAVSPTTTTSYSMTCTGISAVSASATVTVSSGGGGGGTPVSYDGVNVDISNMIPGTPYTITAPGGGDFFDQATSLGITTIRIVDSDGIQFGNEWSQAQWQHVFTRAEQTHMHVILLTANLNREKTLLSTWGFANSPALWMIDVENEPDVCAGTSGLQAEINYAHQVAPNIPATIGGWKCGSNWQVPSDLSRIIGMVDVASPHKYNITTALNNGTSPQTWARNELSAIRQYANGKPIFLEEFGANNGMGATPNDANGTPQTQATIFNGVFQEIAAEKNQNVLGGTAWSYSIRHTFAGEAEDKPWAIVLNNGSQLLPATAAFAPYK